MKQKRYYIIPQRYEDCRGRKPLSYAIYWRRWFRGDVFLGYAFSFSRAWVALQFIRESMKKACQ